MTFMWCYVVNAPVTLVTVNVDFLENGSLRNFAETDETRYRVTEKNQYINLLNYQVGEIDSQTKKQHTKTYLINKYKYLKFYGNHPYFGKFIGH